MTQVYKLNYTIGNTGWKVESVTLDTNTDAIALVELKHNQEQAFVKVDVGKEMFIDKPPKGISSAVAYTIVDLFWKKFFEVG